MLLLKKLVTILIILLLVLWMPCVSYGLFIPNVFQSEDKKILAYAELNAATLTLTSGQKIGCTNINGDSSMSITSIVSPIELVLVIDTSGSMSGSNMTSTKQSATTLVNNLFDIASQIQVSVISFESTARLCTTSSDRNTVLETINSLYASGGTNMSPALDIAKNIFEQTIKNGDEKIYPYLIVLTDGNTENANSCYQKLLALQNSQITIYDILVSGASTEAFTQNNVDARYDLSKYYQ